NHALPPAAKRAALPSPSPASVCSARRANSPPDGTKCGYSVAATLSRPQEHPAYGSISERGTSVSYGYSFEDLLALLHGHAPAKVDAVALHRRRVEHGQLSVGLKIHCLGDGSQFSTLVEGLVSTPEQNCIGLPEQKYISDAGKKGPRTGGLFLRHHAWFGLSAGMSELARRELRLL